jgi:hypothetical protein
MAEPDIRSEIERILAEGAAGAKAAIDAAVERARALLEEPRVATPRPTPRRQARYNAICALAGHTRYAALSGIPRADAVARDLARYYTGSWRFEEALDVCPHDAGTWKALAWHTLKLVPYLASSDRSEPLSSRTISRALGELS